MRICIVGAGAIGGLLGVKLAQVGEEVVAIARGDHLAVIKEKGLTLIEDEKEITVKIQASDDITSVGTFDVVFICVKAHQVTSIVSDINKLCNESTMIVTTQNGLPWWYFQNATHISEIKGNYEDNHIEAVDKDGIISKTIDPKRIIGCVVYPAAYIKESGVIQHVEGNRFPIGELDGSESERIKNLSNILIKAGFKSPILPDIRSELWLKCWGSCCFNPISALTHSTLKQICTFDYSKKLSEFVMTEAQQVGLKLGATFRVPLERRINGAAAVGDHKTSMLQDVEEGRTTEVDALVGSVVELGELTKTNTPHLSTIYYCVKLLDNTLSSENLKVSATTK